MGTNIVGTVDFVGEYDAYLGQHRIKVLEADGTRKNWNEHGLRLLRRRSSSSNRVSRVSLARSESKGPKRSEAPPKSFKSRGGRTFTVGRREHQKARYDGDTLWNDSYPIMLGKKKRAGTLFRNMNYGPGTTGRPKWQASTRQIVWSFGGELPPKGIGFDVVGFDTAREALTAWGKNVDDILDWWEGKPVRSVYSKTGVYQRGVNS